MIFKKIPYEKVLYEWLNNKRKTIKKSTYIKYLYIIETHIISVLGSIDFKKLKSNDIISFLGKEDINTLANSTKTSILLILKSSIKYDLDMKYRKSFDALDIKYKKEKNEITYFTIKEQEIIEDYIKSNMNIRNLSILVALYTGVRIGELCALKGTDIDFINNTISINKTVQRIKNTDGTSKTKLVIDIPKTKSSIRVIPVSEYIIEFLKKYIDNENNYIFTGSDKPKDPRTVGRYFERLLEKLNIKQINFHSLRHTFATRLREQKVDIKVISQLLGHSNWKTTQEIYVHATFDSIKQSVCDLCSSLISKCSQKEYVLRTFLLTFIHFI